jgi:hypothetical protein
MFCVEKIQSARFEVPTTVVVWLQVFPEDMKLKI